MAKKHLLVGITQNDYTNGDDSIQGTSLNDVLHGGAGNDYIFGGDGDDQLYGDDGNDVLCGFRGADQLWGGAGADTFLYGGWYQSPDQNAQRDTIMDFETQDKIDLKAVSHFTNASDPTSGQHLTMNDITVETTGAGQYRVHVSVVQGDSAWDMGIDVVGAAPTADNFILS